MESMGTRLLNGPAPRMIKPIPSVSRPLRVPERIPKSFVMFNRGGLVEPIRSQPPVLSMRASKPVQGKSDGHSGKSQSASFAVDIGESLQEARESATKSVKDLGLAITTAILAAQNTLKSKGLHFKNEGKYKPTWMLSWFWWYSYVRAMCRKIWESTSLVAAKMSSSPLSADARAPFQT
ncbi:hypothetical protein JW721_03300 [Candidatus Micrarchaeota archaeon]|nr:hypothetical protein [Candidatus Micrarchaeota archaeon]